MDQTLVIALDHVKDDLCKEKAYELYVSLDAPLPRTNMHFEPVCDILAQDAREAGLWQFSLDEFGFQFKCHDFENSVALESLQDSPGEDCIKEHLQELKSLLAGLLEAKRVIIYDWRVSVVSKVWPFSSLTQIWS